MARLLIELELVPNVIERHSRLARHEDVQTIDGRQAPCAADVSRRDDGEQLSHLARLVGGLAKYRWNVLEEIDAQVPTLGTDRLRREDAQAGGGRR